MMNWFFFSLCFLLLACTGQKSFIVHEIDSTRKIEVSYSLGSNYGSVNGFFTTASSYVLFNLYGPIGRNVLKIYFESDSVVLIDLINSRRIHFYSKDILFHCKSFFESNNSNSDSLFIYLFINLLYRSSGEIELAVLNPELIKQVNVEKLKGKRTTKFSVIFGINNNPDIIKFTVLNKKLDRVEKFNLLKYLNFQIINFTLDD